jgi:Sec-independent protein translocase protein TatA
MSIFNDKTLKGVAEAAAKIMGEAKKPLHPNQQKLDVHEPEKDELTSKDFEMLRAGKKAKMKEDVQQIDELKKSTLGSYAT